MFGSVLVLAAAFAALSVALAGFGLDSLIEIAASGRESQLGIAWLALTALAMFALAYGKSRTGSALGNRVLQTEARVTAIDGLLALAILVGLVLNAALGWWWAFPAAALVIAAVAGREGSESWRGDSCDCC